MPSRCILIVLDGLGDRSYEVLGGMTPLQAASTPNLDRLATLGTNGLFHAQDPGMALPSENAHFAMFGYSQDDFPGRGCLEALGAGIELAPEDVAILAHFVSVREEESVLILEKDRPPAEDGEIAPLAEIVASHEARGVRFSYVSTRSLDGILTLKGRVSPFITDSDPLLEGRSLIEPEPWADAADDPAAINTAAALGDYLVRCYLRLDGHEVNDRRREAGKPPLNAVATNRAGRHKEVEPFSRRWGLRSLSIASGIVYHGLCSFLGIDVLKVKDSDDPGEDLAQRLELALSKTGSYDFIHVHSKAPDAASHKKDPVGKKRAIEALDRGLGKVLDRLLADRELLLIATSDHSVPCTHPLIHSGEPVPITLAGEGMRRDEADRFDEIHCAGGVLGFIRGRDFMHVVLNGLDRVKLKGLMDTPEDQPYWPGDSRPLKARREGGDG